MGAIIVPILVAVAGAVASSVLAPKAKSPVAQAALKAPDIRATPETGTAAKRRTSSGLDIKRGLASTILTSPLGITDDDDSSNNTLLGG